MNIINIFWLSSLSPNMMTIYRVPQKRSVISKCHMVCVIAPVLLSYKRNVLWFQEIECIAIILSIINCLSTKGSRDINRTFYTSQADMCSVSFSHSLANVVRLTAQCHISVPYMATHNILYLKSGSR